GQGDFIERRIKPLVFQVMEDALRQPINLERVHEAVESTGTFFCRKGGIGERFRPALLKVVESASRRPANGRDLSMAIQIAESLQMREKVQPVFQTAAAELARSVLTRPIELKSFLHAYHVAREASLYEISETMRQTGAAAVASAVRDLDKQSNAVLVITLVTWLDL